MVGKVFLDVRDIESLNLVKKHATTLIQRPALHESAY